MTMKRVRTRIERSRRHGRLVLRGVVAVSLLLGIPLLHAIWVALRSGRQDVIFWAVVGVAMLGAVDLLAVLLVRRQQRLLDSAEEVVSEMEAD